MQLGAFAALESDIIAALFRAIEWYGKNAPDELEKIAAAPNNTAIKDYAAWYLKNLRQGKKMQNLLKNGKFEIRNAEVEEQRWASGKDSRSASQAEKEADKGWRGALGCFSSCVILIGRKAYPCRRS